MGAGVPHGQKGLDWERLFVVLVQYLDCFPLHGHFLGPNFREIPSTQNKLSTLVNESTAVFVALTLKE